MKTTSLLSSLVVVVAFTVTLGGIYPPPKQAHAKAGVSKPASAPEKKKTVIIPSKPPSAPKQAKTKPSVQNRTEHQVQLTERQKLLQAAGVAKSDWSYAEDVINRESGWCPTKWEGEYGACTGYHGVPDFGGYGLCQSTPGSKMAVMGSGWQTDPVKQIKWCDQYARTYGSWAAAVRFKDCLGRCYSPRTHTYQSKETHWF